MTDPGARVPACVIAFTVLLPGLASCDPPPPTGDLGVVREVRGDTTIVTSRGTADTLHLDSVRVLWRSPELVGPRSMARFADRLVVGDPTRVHLVPLEGGEPKSVGREGAGPGEYT